MDLRTFRQDKGWTLNQMGEALGVTGVTVHRWEVRKARPSLDAIEDIQRITGGAVTVADFMRPSAPDMAGAA